MNILNDENSNIFKETIKKQKKYIDKRRKVIINRILETNIIFQGNTKEEIALRPECIVDYVPADPPHYE